MSKLRFREKQVLEAFLEMGGGYVLNFSDRTFAEFFADFDVDIDDPRYSEGHSGSKANRLRSFWEMEPDGLVATVIRELVSYANSYRGDPGSADECVAVAARLAGVRPPQRPPPVAAPLPVHPPPPLDRPIEIFFSYAHEDEDLMDDVRRQLIVHERLGFIEKWHDRLIPAGDEWKTQIDERIRRAQIIVLFVSPHFLGSRYCYEIEGSIALDRHRAGEAVVIPVVLRACDWTASPFGDLQGLPRDGHPVTQWPDRDQVTLDIARGIVAAAQSLAGGGG
jgi:hypothetical protein